MRHDNCKNCVRGCEHAGTDREFCVPTGKESCKKVGAKQSALIEKFAERVELAFYEEFDEIIPSIMAARIDKIAKEIGSETGCKRLSAEELRSLQIKGAENLAFKIEEAMAYYGDEDTYTKKNILLVIKNILEEIKNEHND